VAASFILVAVHWPDLPDRIPLHFGFSGRANRWGNKAGIWFVPGVSAGFYLLMTLVSRNQALVNLPISVDREQPETRRLLAQFVNVLKAITAVVLFYISWGSVNTALGRMNGLGREFLPILIAATSIPIVVYLLRLKRQRDSLDRNRSNRDS